MKLNKLVAVFALALPLTTAPIMSNYNHVNAATTTKAKSNSSHDYVSGNIKGYKTAKTYTVKSNKVTTYQAAPMADQPVISFGNAKTVKPNSSKVKVDQKINVKVSKQSNTKLMHSKKAYQAAKNVSYLHIKHLGWVKASDLKK